MQIDLSDLLPLSEAAALIPSARGRRVHVSTLYRWLRAGRIQG